MCGRDTTVPVATPKPGSFYVSGRAPDHLSAEQAKLECDRVAVYVNLNSGVTCTWFSSHFTVLFEFPKGEAKRGELMNNLPAADVVMTGWQWEQHVELTPFLDTIVGNPNIKTLKEGDDLPDLGAHFAGLDVNIYLPQDITHTQGFPGGEHTCILLVKPRVAINYGQRRKMQAHLTYLRAHLTWTGYGFRVSCYEHHHAAGALHQLDKLEAAKTWTASWLRPPTPSQSDTNSKRLNVNYAGAADMTSALMLVARPDPDQCRQLCFSAVAYFGANAALLSQCKRMVFAFVGPNASEAATRFQAYHELGTVGIATKSIITKMKGTWYTAAELPRVQATTTSLNPCWDEFKARLEFGDTLGWYTPKTLRGHRDDMWMRACNALFPVARQVMACEYGVLAAFQKGRYGPNVDGWQVVNIFSTHRPLPPLSIRAPPCNFWSLYAGDAILHDTKMVYNLAKPQHASNGREGRRRQP